MKNKMNKYHYVFIVECPSNSQPIVYHLTLIADKKVFVEHIVTACSLLKRGYHEDIADKLHELLGGKQTITAHHHGVEIETIRE